MEAKSSAAPGTVIQFEKGSKAVGAGELLALATTLGVSPAWFFADSPPGSAVGADTAPAAERVAEAERFLNAYMRIADPKVRRDLLGLIRAAGE